MPDLLLDLRYLRYAITVAEHGSFRRAADILNLSQSTVSRRIQLLERRLGAPLFDRDKSGARLTPTGARFLSDAAPGADVLAQAAEKLIAAKQSKVGRIKIGFVGSLSRGHLAELLRLFRARSAVSVAVEELSSVQAMMAVRSGRLDVAIVATNSTIPGLASRQLFKERLYVALPATHRLAAHPHLHWSDLRDEVLLVRSDVEGPHLQELIAHEWAAMGAQAKVTVQSVGRDNLLCIVAGGLGVSIEPSSTLGLPFPYVTFVPLGSDEGRLTWNAVWLASNEEAPLKLLLELSNQIATSE